VDVGLPDCPESCGQCLDVNTTEEFANKKDENGKLKNFFNVVVDKYCRHCFQGYLDWICSGMANKKDEKGKLKKKQFFVQRRR
jgi:hypothetical protein